MVTDDDRVAAGAASFPDPGVDDSQGTWIAAGTIILMAQTGTQSDGDGGQFGRSVVDSKAMRKFSEDDNLVMVVQNVQLSGTPPVDIVIGVNVLTSS